jgi:hypothetical protein
VLLESRSQIFQLGGRAPQDLLRCGQGHSFGLLAVLGGQGAAGSGSLSRIVSG